MSLLSLIRRFVAVVDEALERQASRGGGHRLRTKCPICGKDVAVTNHGLTYYHRVPTSTPANRSHYHTVRLKDGVEV